MDETLVRTSVEAKADFEFSRSGGPGGQNVNKVNTRVTIRVSLQDLDGLSDAERARVAEKLESRIAAGRIAVSVSEERTQEANRRRAVDRIETLVIAAARIPKRRKATKPSRASKERRLAEKRSKSAIKRGRNDRAHPED
ncbi:MAG: alternative ribosome rescue aminoacyl-tRNA hydrolase ArfB [Spirochaetes bacterium]|nr:alternative ribosome rescue aminoacyl-tRNA hydrolase ArfB [Spirochaetota bacterium]